MKAGGFNILRRLNARRSDGFTIVETMIVLAVTGVLFVSVMAVMAGRQSKTQFNQSVNSLKTEIEQVIGEVQSGYFPDSGSIQCSAGASGAPVISEMSTRAQGTNENCVFLGKVIAFDSANDNTYNVYTLAGAKDRSSVGASMPTAVRSFTDTKRLQFGLKPMTNKSVGIVTDIGTGAGGILYGTRTTKAIDLGSSIAPETISSFSGWDSVTAASGGGVRICFESGTTVQSALLTIRSNSVTLDIKNNQDCSG